MSSFPSAATARYLIRRRSSIIEAALERLVEARAPHYASAETGDARLRLGRLYDGVVDALATRDVSSLLDYVRGLADERYAAGYDLGELQTAFNVLEEAIWRHLLAGVPSPSCGEALGAVSTVLGMAKDALARRYVELAAHGRAPALDVGALFAGTDRH
jgi:hypothetical protein